VQFGLRKPSDLLKRTAIISVLAAFGLVLASCSREPSSPSDRTAPGEKTELTTADVQKVSISRGARNQLAVVVGVNDYGEGLQDLQYAINDAEAISELLVREFGFDSSNVRLLTGRAATKQAILQTLDQWVASRKPTKRDSLLFFFSGHGEERLLAGSDARGGQPDSWVSFDELRRRLERNPCDHRLVILDCCFAGSLFTQARKEGDSIASSLPLPGVAGGLSRSGGNEVIRRGGDSLGYYLANPAFVGLTATRQKQLAVDGWGDDEHSVFTWALIRTMKQRANSTRDDRAFTFRQLASLVESTVVERLGDQQVPDWGQIEPSEGDYVFVPTLRNTVTLEFSAPTAIEVDGKAEGDNYILCGTQLSVEQGWGYRIRITGLMEPLDKPIYGFLRVPIARGLTAQRLTLRTVPLAINSAMVDNLVERGSVRTVVFVPGKGEPDWGPPGSEVQELQEKFRQEDLVSETVLDSRVKFAWLSDVQLDWAGEDPLEIVEVNRLGDTVAVLDLGPIESSADDGIDANRRSGEGSANLLRYPMQLLSPDQERKRAGREMLDLVNWGLDEAIRISVYGTLQDAVEYIREVVLQSIERHACPDPLMKERAAAIAINGMHEIMADAGDASYQRLRVLKGFVSRPIERFHMLGKPLRELTTSIEEDWYMVIRLDEPRLMRVGVSADTIVNISVMETTILDVLDSLGESLPIGFEYDRQDQIVLVPRDEAMNAHETIVYFIGDMITEDRTAESVAEVVNEAASERPSEVQFSLRINYQTRSLVVTTNWRCHLRAFDRLQELRGLNPDSVAELRFLGVEESDESDSRDDSQQ
jgi:hypothetical protein